MALNSKIEWTEHTANLWHGCTKVNEGCNNCYAETLARRWGNDIWGNDKPRKEISSVWKDLEKYQKLAKKLGQIHRVFVGSMMDIFEKPMALINSKGEPLSYNTDHLRDKLFDNISNGNYNNLMFLFLTKRPSNINKYIPSSWLNNSPENVMFGTSVVNQDTACKLIPQLLMVKGKRFLSVEPQLGMIDFDKITQTVSPGYFGNCLKWYHQPYNGGEPLPDFPVIHWIIQGGESGHNKRPFNLEWAYFMKNQCQQYNVPYFFKQIDKIQEIPDDLKITQTPSFF